jgi:hypothetical protein
MGIHILHISVSISELQILISENEIQEWDGLGKVNRTSTSPSTGLDRFPRSNGSRGINPCGSLHFGTMVCSRSPLASVSDELTPPLPAAPAERRRPTPLPRVQLCLLLLMQFAEPVCSKVSDLPAERNTEGRTDENRITYIPFSTRFAQRKFSFYQPLFCSQLINDDFEINGGDPKKTRYYAASF